MGGTCIFYLREHWIGRFFFERGFEERKYICMYTRAFVEVG